MDSILQIQSLSMRFGGLMALNSVTYDVPKAQVLGLIGPNGAGKTTMFNCITGVYKPTSGDMLFHKDSGTKRVNGRKPEKVTELGIARTFQNIRLFTDLTVLDNVRIGRHPRTSGGFFGAVLRSKGYKAEEKQIVDDAMKWLTFVGLDNKALSQSSSLAYGDQRRLEIARALATEPQVLLLDEPAAGMNPSETQLLDDLIQDILNIGVTIVLIEHDMKLVMNICHNLVVLDHGELIASGKPQDVKDNPKVIEAYLGRGAAQNA